MSLREQMAYAISHGNLQQSEHEETAADLIGALAMADPLGAALWRVTSNLDPVAFRRARSMLVEKICATHLDLPTELVRRVCQQAMEEWLACLCSTCNGRSFVTSAGGVRSTCKACHGTGRGRSTDAERMTVLRVGKATYSKLVAVLDEAHAMLNASDKRVSRQVAVQLGRADPKLMSGKGKR